MISICPNLYLRPVYACFPLAAICFVATLLGGKEERTLLFSDDFDDRDVLGDGYYRGIHYKDAFSIVDGVLVATQTNPKHGSVIRKMIDFKDIDIELDFRFNGGTRFNFVLDDENEKSVHSTHISRASVSLGGVLVQDDKTGFMNLKIMKKRRNPDLSEAERSELEAFLATKRRFVKRKFVPGQWYTLRILMVGDKLEAFVDGESVVSLRSEGFDHPTKTKFGMTTNGDTIEFDNLKVFAVR